MTKHGRRSPSPCKVLCVEADAYLGDLLLYALPREGYRAQLASTGAGALQAIKADRPDLVLLDIRLPDADGLVLCGYVRTAQRVPVLVLCGRPSDEDEVAAFAQGADDFVAKPFNLQVLMYRIRAVLRRAIDLEPFDVRTFRVGPGTFSAELQEIYGPEGRVKLTPIESGILNLLLSHEGQVFSAARIMERVWGDGDKGTVSSVKTHVRRLRQKVAGAIGDLDVIQTIPGLGYVLRQGPGLLESDDAEVPDGAAPDPGDAVRTNPA
jgi:DNA-binding response OmpR family regulator